MIRTIHKLRYNNGLGMIMLGAGRRAAIAIIVVAALWAMFFWATFTPGGL